MKKWKALVTGILVFCLLPWSFAWAEEEGQETEDPYPDSYYYTIESNETVNWPQGPAIEAASAVVMDMDAGTFLYSKNATAKMYPASITKIMTTLLLVENCNLDDEITFSEIVYDLEEGSSHLGIQPGEKMTLRDAAYGIMLASANDMANGVAEYIGGSISGFADMMNAKASELGCVNTHFANPHGLYQEDHYTCAYDMALIARAAYENPIFREIAGTRIYCIPKTNLTDEERYFTNHQKILQKDEEYYRKWCTGGKTGYTEDCLNTLVTYGEKGGQRLVSVVLRVNGADKAYLESIGIMEYGFENFYTKKYESGSSNLTFYDIMGLRYLGDASGFQSPVWERSPAQQCFSVISLPNNASASDLTYEVTQENRNERFLSYKYNGCPVGTSRGDFRTIAAPAQMVFEKDVEVKAPAESVLADTDIQIESFNEVLTQATEIFQTGYQMFTDYTENHFMTVIIGGTLLLVVLVVFIIILIFRCTSESRIRRRRKQEERERKKREEEIDQMTTAEIEAELRAVMEQERLRKEQERIAQAEAERAAEEARIMEEKAHETERLIDELEQERQERLSSKK